MPCCCVVGQLTVEDPAGAVVFEPTAQAWPSTQQRIMGKLCSAIVEDDQSLGGERLQHCIDMGALGIRTPGVQLGPGYRAASKPVVAAGHCHVPQDFPR